MKASEIVEGAKEFRQEIEADLNHRHETIMTVSSQEWTISFLTLAINALEAKPVTSYELATILHEAHGKECSLCDCINDYYKNADFVLSKCNVYWKEK